MQCDSICTDVSSVQITFSNVAPIFCLAYSRRFTRLRSRIVWQYAVPRLVHPNKRRPLKARFSTHGCSDICKLRLQLFCCSLIIFVHCVFIANGVSLVGCPLFGKGLMVPQMSICRFSLHTVCRQVDIFSVSSSSTTSLTLAPLTRSVFIRSRTYIES